MPDARARLAVALDLPDRPALLAMARRVAPEAGFLKLGLEAFVAEGPSLVRELVATGSDVFLDLKLHDIPNTVGRAAAAAAATGAAILNCHASGGSEMMRAFADQARAAASKAGLEVPRLIAVTVLTSLDAAALAAIGLDGSPREAAVRLAVLARESGLDGVVCSPGGNHRHPRGVRKGLPPRRSGREAERRGAGRSETRRDAGGRDPCGRRPPRRGPSDHGRARPGRRRARDRRGDRR